MNQKKKLPGELALLLGLLHNSFASCMLILSTFGMSVTSGVPYIISLRFPVPSFGAWNAIIQCLWMLVPIVVLRKIKLSYFLSFLLAFLFGALLDFWNYAFEPLPVTFGFRVLWFVLGFINMSIGIAYMMRCKLPVLPFDTVTREFVVERGVGIRKARTLYDITNLCLCLILGFALHGKIVAIGIGSILCAAFFGTGAGAVASFIDRFFVIEPRIPLLAKIT